MHSQETGSVQRSLSITTQVRNTLHEDDDTGTPDALQPEYIPETVLYREDESAALVDALSNDGTQHLYIYGDRGTGKTLLTRNSLVEHASSTSTCYVPCTTIDTQYQVLKHLYRTLTGNTVNNGHHTAHLQKWIDDVLADQTVTIVLDEIDFLLENDGNDLLYFLSRMQHATNITIVAISSNHPDPSSVIEERAISSLQPRTVNFDPYSATQASEILEERLVEARLMNRVIRDALAFLVSNTRNIRLGLLWLAQAATIADNEITKDLLSAVKGAAVQQYREVLLDGFSPHHYILLEAIGAQSTEDYSNMNTGAVYKRYVDRCEGIGETPRTHRWVSDFLTHLELLNLIDVDHINGGNQGRTRKIRLVEVI